MSGADYAEWLGVVHAKAMLRRIVFLQLGSSNEPARRALVSSLTTFDSVEEYLTTNLVDHAATVVVNGVEEVAGPGKDTRMGRLRERVVRDVGAGSHVVLLSRAPRIAFPSVPGSSLLDDASFAHAPFVDGVGAEHFPTCTIDGAEPSEVLNRVLTELGSELCASLDRVIYENLLIGEQALGLLNARELEALDGASITVPEGTTKRSWNFSTHLVPLKKALDEVLTTELSPPRQLEEVSAGLWVIERIIRREVRARALAAWGESWKSQCLNADLSVKVLERATEAAYLAAASLKQLRDPLEWLSLGELMQLRDRKEIGDLGMSAAHWRQFTTQIMPIRNRLAHMRALHPQDAADVIKWQRVIELLVGTP